MDHLDVAIVGGGAAGLATAIFCARRRPDLRIAILDGAGKIGAKILVSGGGRCNVTNVRVRPEDFWGGSRNTIRRVLGSFTEKQTVDFFRELSVPLHEEQWGKLFPDSNSAKTILAALLRESERLGVRLRTSHRVVGVKKQADRFDLEYIAPGAVKSELPHGIQAKFVVLATGGKSLPKTGSDGFGYELAESLGHSILSPTPGLVPLELDGQMHAALSGVSHEVELTISVEGEKPVRINGPMLWTHFGASGPAVMDASRHWHRAQIATKAVTLTANFLPGDDVAGGEGRLIDLTSKQPRILVRNALAGVLPARLADCLCSAANVPTTLTMGQLDRDSRKRLLHLITAFPLRVRGSRGYNYAEVTAGGVPLTEIDQTMQSRKCPGLFLVGEILDVDGRIGGFNFQWAWSSGYVAAEGINRNFPRQGDVTFPNA